MGLSRKLGGGAAASSSRPETPVCVDYKWSTQAYALRDILARFQLPCVVQCAADPGSVVWADFQFDLRQPLLLHAARTVRKIHARSLKVEGQADQLQEFGPPLAIPEDYDGWFYPVTKKDPTALPRHTRIEGAAASPARQFLVTTTLPAFVPSMVPATGPKYSPHEVMVGEVLTKVDVVTDDFSLEVATPSTVPELLPAFRQSLRCLDENQHEVIVPFHYLALLHDVAENYELAVKAAQRSGGGIATEGSGMEAEGEGEGGAASCVPGVVSTRTIVASGNDCLPRVFRHVLGEEPALEGTFSGLMRCYSVFTEETVMAATMSSLDLSSMFELPSCLELSANSSAKFRIGLNASDLKRTNQYVAALRTCEELAHSYVRAIKASFTVHPVTSEQRDVDLSFNEDGSSVVDGPDVGAWAKEVGENSTSREAKGEEKKRASATSGATQLPGETTGYDGRADDEVDSSSVSEAPDDSGDVTSMSDAPEVEASSEFHISWGELKRARSYSGSLSDASDNDAEDSDTQVSSATESDTEMSSTDRDAQISSATESDCNSVVINDYSSSTWQDSVVSSSNNFRDVARKGKNQSSDYSGASCHLSHVTQDVDVDLCPVDREGPTTSSHPHQVSVESRLGVPDASDSTEDRCTQDTGGWMHNSESIQGYPRKIVIADRTGAVTKSMARAIIPGNHAFRNMEISSADSASFHRCNNDSGQLGVRAEVSGTSGGHVIKKQQPSHELEHSTRQRAGSVPMVQTVAEKGHNSSSSGHLAPHSQPSSVPSGLDCLTTQWPPKKRTQCMSNGDDDRVEDKNARQSQEKADDFVKTLGDKLLLVSRRTSSPRYQRLETNNDDAPDTISSKTNDSRMFAQKQYGRSLSSITYDRSVRSANDQHFEDTVVMVQDTSFSTDSEEDSGGEMPEKSIFDEFDLLHEEIV